MYSLWFDVILWRGVTAAWVPFFDDMDAIIFLAPISCFDQVLEEDENVNRLVRRFLSLFVDSQSLNIITYGVHACRRIQSCSGRWWWRTRC